VKIKTTIHFAETWREFFEKYNMKSYDDFFLRFDRGYHGDETKSRKNKSDVQMFTVGDNETTFFLKRFYNPGYKNTIRAWMQYGIFLAFSFNSDSFLPNISCVAIRAIEILQTFETRGTVRDARGLASRIYTVSFAIAYWMFIRPTTLSSVAIFLVYSFIVWMCSRRIDIVTYSSEVMARDEITYFDK
jgi:hypothetical protein